MSNKPALVKYRKTKFKHLEVVLYFSYIYHTLLWEARVEVLQLFLPLI